MRLVWKTAALATLALSIDCANVSGTFRAFDTTWNNARLFEPTPNVRHRTLASKVLGTEVGYAIYLPRDYATSQKRYPVLYFLHGACGNEVSSLELIRGRNLEYIVVFPNGGNDTMYANHHLGKLQVHDFLIDELIPHIDTTYRTIARRAGRLIAGFSMGGWGAHMLAYKHPELFGAVQSVGAAFQNADQFSDSLGATWRGMFGGKDRFFASYSPRDLSQLKRSQIKHMPIQIWIGRRDYLRRFNREMHDHLSSLGVAHQFFHASNTPVLADVDHDFDLYAQRVGDQLIGFHRTFFARLTTSSDTGNKP